MYRYALLVGLMIASCPAVMAELVWLQNDGFVMGGQAYVQLGFVANEICASTYTLNLSHYPCKLQTVRVLVQGGGAANFNVKIWTDSGALQPGTLLLTEACSLSSGSNWRDIDVSSHNIILTSGGVRVGLEFTANPPPSFCRDGDGNIQTHKNLVYAMPTGTWLWSENLGLQGDWILRLQVDTNYAPSPTATPTGSAGPTFTPTPSGTTGPTLTPTPTQPGQTPTATPNPSHSPTPTPTGSTTTGTIQWDADEYFGLDAHARVSVIDADLNTNPGVQEQLIVEIWSQSDSYPGGITVTLYETGMASDTFQTVFPHVSFSQTSSNDAEDLLQVADGDTIHARYLEANPFGERLDSAVWYLQQGITIALVMPAHQFPDGSLCFVDLEFSNSGDTQNVDLYVLLDVFGAYFCYPTWADIEAGLQYDDMYVPGYYEDVLEIIAPFTMPPVDPVGPLFFHAAMFNDGHLTIEEMASNLDSWEFWLE